MKYVKMLGLLAVAAAAMMAFAATASATTVTAPEGTAYTGTIHATSEGSTTLDGILDVTCTASTVHGESLTHGSGVTAKGDIKTLTFTGCGNDTVVVSKAGSLEMHYVGGENKTNGTLTSTGAEITIIADTIFGNIHCIFTTSNTDVGTLTSATTSTGHATLHIDSAAIPRTGGTGGGLCGSSGEWTGSYKVNTPTGLKLDA